MRRQDMQGLLLELGYVKIGKAGKLTCLALPGHVPVRVGKGVEASKVGLSAKTNAGIVNA